MKLSKSYTTIIFCLSLILSFIACKKYSEDGKRSWHKPEKRMLGNWYLKEFLVDGVESAYNWNEYHTSDVTDTIRWQLIDTRFSFNNEHDEKDINIVDTNVYMNSSRNYIVYYIHVFSDWELQDKKQKLYFGSNYNYSKGGATIASFSIFGDVSDVWDIQKLTDKELILEATSNDNKHLRVKFQKWP